MARATENAPVKRRPAPTVRIEPIAPRRLTTSEPAKIPTAVTSSRIEYVSPPVDETWYARASTAGRRIGVKNAARVLIARGGRASRRDQTRRSAPDTE